MGDCEEWRGVFPNGFSHHVEDVSPSHIFTVIRTAGGEASQPRHNRESRPPGDRQRHLAQNPIRHKTGDREKQGSKRSPQPRDRLRREDSSAVSSLFKTLTQVLTKLAQTRLIGNIHHRQSLVHA